MKLIIGSRIPKHTDHGLYVNVNVLKECLTPYEEFLNKELEFWLDEDPAVAHLIDSYLELLTSCLEQAEAKAFTAGH